LTTSRACPECGSLEAVDARFCSRCGHAFGEAARRERRALVSIVFCDLVDSTALGERLDAEVLRGVQSGYFAVAAEALQAHGGQVEKFIGDAVMCVFGLPAAHEDDALRAVRGALDVTAAIERFNVRLSNELGVQLAVRVGVNTGEVIAGDHASGQGLVTGDAVNTAARLEGAAPAGGILIGELTHRLVAAVVDAEPAQPVSAKGKTEALAAWRVRGLASPAAGPADGSSRLVGRIAELGALRAAFDRVLARRRAELLIVSGDAGIGKSRLVAEFVSHLPSGRALFGACPSYGRGNTYRPLRDVLEVLAPQASLTSVAALLAGQPDERLAAQSLLRVTGFESGAVRREEAFGAVARLLAALAADEPLVIVFDDLHWAEPTFLDLLQFLAEALRAPVLIVGTTRQELFEQRPGLAPSALRLEPLSSEASAELLAQKHVLEPEDAQRLIARADGNPLFLEQLGAALEEGTDSVPPDIASLIAARLDRVDAQGRSTLEAAAIVGREFWPGALAPLLDDEREVSALLPALDRLEANEFVGGGASGALPGPTGLSSIFIGERLHFRHALVHDAVLSAMPKLRRAELHERFAASLSEYADHEPAVVGYHLEQAARLRMELRPRDAPPAVAVAAASLLEQAGMQALDRGDAPAANLLLTRARALVPETSPEAAQIDAVLRGAQRR
jgi:class 3 adenylate cyclase